MIGGAPPGLGRRPVRIAAAAFKKARSPVHGGLRVVVQRVDHSHDVQRTDLRSRTDGDQLSATVCLVGQKLYAVPCESSAPSRNGDVRTCAAVGVQRPAAPADRPQDRLSVASSSSCKANMMGRRGRGTAVADAGRGAGQERKPQPKPVPHEGVVVARKTRSCDVCGRGLVAPPGRQEAVSSGAAPACRLRATQKKHISRLFVGGKFPGELKAGSVALPGHRSIGRGSSGSQGIEQSSSHRRLARNAPASGAPSVGRSDRTGGR